jgi:hypothetical protein
MKRVKDWPEFKMRETRIKGINFKKKDVRENQI